MSLIRLIINSNLSAVGFKSVCDLTPGRQVSLNNFLNYLGGVVGGTYSANLAFEVGGVQAAGTITQASTGAANDQTLTIAGVTFTAKTTGATGNQWNRNNTVATSATNLAAAINASANLAGICTATAALGVVTITAVSPGIVGNALVAANVDCANTTVVSFVGGTAGTAYTVDLR